MTTRDDLVEEVLLNLGGFLTDQELTGSLASPIGAGDTSFTVTGSVFTDASQSGFRPGVCEVGSEVIYVGAVNPTTGQFTGVIRGFRGTTASAWPGGTQVRDNPRVPRLRVVKALNDTLAELHPRVYAVVTTTATGLSPYSTAIELPATTSDVLNVFLSIPGVSSAWTPSRRWKYIAQGTTVSTSKKLVQVLDAWDGAEAQIVCARPAGQFVEASGTNEEYTAATALPVWTKELLTLGAAYKLVAYLDAGRIAERTAEGDLLAVQTPIGQGQKLSAHLFALFSSRLDAAEARLRGENNIGGVHYEN